MSFHPRPALALLAVVVLSLGLLNDPLGFYTPVTFAAAIISLGISIAACVVRDTVIIGSRGARIDGVVLSAMAAAILSFVSPFSMTLLYGEDVTTRLALWLACWFGSIATGLLAAVIVGGRQSGRPHGWRRALFIAVVVLTFLSGFATRALVIRASPGPVVDVFNLLRDGADHLIAGANPYTNDIVSPYGTPRAEKFGVAEPSDPRPAGYPPLPLILSVPPRLFGADVRWSNVVCDLIAAFAILWCGIRRGRSALGSLAAAIYLNLPRTTFIIEQSWYEPMIAALFGLGFVLAESSGFAKRVGYIALGLGLTAKQFGLPLLFPLLAGHRRQWRLIALGLVVGSLVILPWLTWSPRDFLDIVIWKHLGRPPQPRSITVASFLMNEFDVTPPRIAGWLLAAAAIAGISYATPRDSAATALGVGAALLAFCVFHTQGFPNYFYLVQYLWLLGFVGLLPRGEGVRDAGAAA
jgi:hypothetical protein